MFLSTKCEIRVLCARQFQNKIAESVYTLLKIQIDRFGLQAQFKITDNSIVNTVRGSEFLFYGLWRHINEIKSLEGIDICWIEEAHNLTQEQWEILEPTVRKDGSQFWILFNPRLVTDFVRRRFVTNTPPKTIKRHINYEENPLPLPEIEAGHYLLDALHDLGLVWPSGFGPVPLPWGEIDAYSRSMDEPLEPFERRALRDMSAAYCSWLKRGEDPLALPPG